MSDALKPVRLGKSGLRVSPLCLGTMMFGGRTDEPTSARIIHRAFEAGVNFLDTADVYSKGISEEISGRAIKTNRDRWVVATKVANIMGDCPNQKGLSRGWIMEAAENSLKRLNTDYIDIYYLHREDSGTPLEETVGAVGDLISSGKIRYFGLSNFRAWRAAELINLCKQMNVPRPVILQPYYNALNRMPEVELLPMAEYYGLGVFPYSPVARGILTGKYMPDSQPPEDSRVAVKDTRMMQTEWRPESLEIAQTLKQRAEERNMSPVQFAVNWCLYNKLITGVIAGPRTEEQWEDYLGAFEHSFTPEDEALVDSLVAAGHPSTPGYSDPYYPLTGRKVPT